MPPQIQTSTGTPHELDGTSIGNTIKAWWPETQGDLTARGYPGAFLVDMPDVDPKWYYGPGQPKTLSQVKQTKLADLAALRWQKETAGITVNGAHIATDDRSRANLIAVRIKVKESAAYTVNWKTDTGFVTLTAAQIIAIADAVAFHIQECFDNEADHATAIEALTDVQTAIAYDFTTGWP
jgi:hypothetical protein